MIYLDLFVTFFKIGLFSFGGGYVMIPLISREIISHQWISGEAFIQIIGIAEMTPGPIAINSATFVGYQVAGMLGALCATLGVAMPSLLIVLFVSSFFFKYSRHPLSKRIFYYLRPIVAALILTAAIAIAKDLLLVHDAAKTGLNVVSAIIGLVSLGLAIKTKLHPIALIIIAGSLGYLAMVVGFL